MPEADLIPVTDLNQVPEFKTELEEAEFWDTRTLTGGLMSRAQAAELVNLLPPVRERPTRSTPTSLRLGVDLERRLKALAERKGMNYQTLLKQFVLERVYEEEKRLGVI